MKNSYLIFLLFFTSLFFLGCDNGLEGFSKEDKTLSLTTFNINLTEDLPLYEERAKQIEKVLSEADSDILCIQGVFFPEDLSAVRNALKDKYGVNHSTTDNSKPEIIPPSCMDNDLAPVMACYMNNCMGNTDPTCVVTNCWGEMLALPADCRNCLLGEGIGGITGDITDLLGNCTQEGEVIYSNEGKNDVILATRLKFQDQVYNLEKLSSTGNLRVALSAMIDFEKKEGLGKIHVVCSGLSQAAGEYSGLYQSWEQEQLLQVQELKDIAASKDSDLAIILGDFQSNVAGGENILENNPGPIALFEADGWYDPYFDVKDDINIECTVCPENPMVQATKESVPDHIIFSTKDNLEFFTERVFLNRFTLIDEKNKTRTRYSISDHYGIKTTVTKTDR
jgi:hypothetical protein